MNEIRLKGVRVHVIFVGKNHIFNGWHAQTLFGRGLAGMAFPASAIPKTPCFCRGKLVPAYAGSLEDANRNS